MYPELYLYVERARARELRADARRHARTGEPRAGAERRRPGGSAARALEVRLGWVLVEAGLRLVHRYH
ncbi:hypothetical protein ACIBO5_03080 [Nonomuraea angiospora]|uniref:hypothetical protein n=1 Tax=Nonomuraea angiospora TaxID=46172 RepID=UPI0029BF3A2E|nr:hypothetical protein [Nonomuraea angiospora]MDX3103408.1 hypothetical protein [Nonomuraea angiospora]